MTRLEENYYLLILAVACNVIESDKPAAGVVRVIGRDAKREGEMM